ncbi:MAG: hypothetical protein ABIA93_01230 [Candidatus Woesearchaeota archaeon]
MANKHIVEEHIYLVLVITCITTVLLFIPALGALSNGVTRSLSSTTVQKGATFTITLDVISTTERYVLIEESIPSGFTIADAGGGSTAQSGYLRWIFLNSTPLPNMTIQYALKAGSQSGSYILSGQYLADGSNITKITGGQDMVTIPAAVVPTSSGGGGGGGGGLFPPIPESEQDNKTNVSAVTEEPSQEQDEASQPTVPEQPQPETSINSEMPPSLPGVTGRVTLDSNNKAGVFTLFTVLILLSLAGTVQLFKKHAEWHVSQELEHWFHHAQPVEIVTQKQDSETVNPSENETKSTEEPAEYVQPEDFENKEPPRLPDF